VLFHPCFALAIRQLEQHAVAHLDDDPELLDRLRPPSAEVGQLEPPPPHEVTQPLEQHERASLVQDRRRVELIHRRRRKETSWWRRERHGVTRFAQWLRSPTSRTLRAWCEPA